VTADDPLARSADLVAANLVALRGLFPDAFTDGRVDFTVLRQLLGDAVDDGEERYGLTWSGKRQARRLALTPSAGTLLPVREDSVDWDTTRNLMIEGENLEVLKLLQKSYARKVRVIYIDPPYNTGNDFVYPDDYTDSIGNYLRRTGQVDTDGVRNTSNPETNGRHHTDWLNMMYPRLLRARDMPTANGLLIISIDEHEYSALRMLCISVFGESNIVGTIIWKNSTDNNPTNIATEHEYILFIARNKDAIEKEWKASAPEAKSILEAKGAELIALFREDKEELQEKYRLWFNEHREELRPLDRYKYIDQGGVYTGSQSVHNPGGDAL
jgi:adenine-specific DNA-methyltransferase